MKKLLIFLMVVVMTTMTARAYDFMVDGLCYDINEDGISVTVTYEYNSWSSPWYYDLSGSLNIPSSVTYNGNIYMVTSIGNWAFRSCTGLTSVTIPNSVTSIGNWAFYRCSGLTSLSIGKSVSSIGDEVFVECNSLKTVTWNAKDCDYSSFNSRPFADLTSITNFNFGSTVERIPSYLCYGLSGLTSVTIPKTVKSIGEEAFMGCSGLKEVTWNAKNCEDFLYYYGSSPFYELTNITSFCFGNEVEKIPAYLCDGLSGLTFIEVPSSVKAIGKQAFKGCYGITKVEISDIDAWCNIDFDSSDSNPLCYGNTSKLYLNGSELVNLIIPTSITKINKHTFLNCKSLISVKIPNTVIEIGYRAFYNCSNLTTIEIPNSVATIDSEAFEYCSELSSVTIGNSVTTIGQNAFSYCNGLTEVNISDIAAWCDISFSNTSSNPLVFAQNLYLNGSKVTNLVIPNSISTIKQYAFYGCKSLTSMELPNTIMSIGKMAFGVCSGLTSIHSRILEPQNVNYEWDGWSDMTVLMGVPAETCKLYVPIGTLEAYQSTNPWNAFTNIIEVKDGDVNGDGYITAADVTALYDFMLNNDTTHLVNGDQNGDGDITAADVTAVYDVLLGSK